MPVQDATPISKKDDKKVRSSSIAPFALGAVFIILFAITFSTLRKNKVNSSNEIDKVDNPVTYEPEIKIISEDSENFINVDTDKLVATTPWTKGIIYSDPKSEPSSDELTNIYKGLRESYTTADLKKFTEVASSEMQWMTNMDLVESGTTSNKIIIMKAGSRTGKNGFTDIALERATKPFRFDNGDLVYKNMFPTKMEQNDSKFLLVDSFRSTQTLIKYSNYDNVYVVCYDLANLKDFSKVGDNQIDCHLRVVFVFESGEWKVLDESWLVSNKS